jgi:hypothetical protein
VFGRCEPQPGIAPFDRLVAQVMPHEPSHSARRVFWIVDHGSGHRGEPVERVRARWPQATLVHTPIHASWLNQIELYFSIVQRKVLTPNDFRSLTAVKEPLFHFQAHASHAPDEIAKFGVEPRAADRVRPRLPPPPVEREALAVPREHRRRLHDHETGSPARPDPAQPDPEHPVPRHEAGSATGALEDPELMAEREVLEGEGRRPEEQGAEKHPDTDHEQHGVTSASGIASEPKLYRISDGGGKVSSAGTRRSSS